jgi:hypothetical protein
MDWDLYMKLVASGASFRHSAYPVGAFRVHPAQVTSSSFEAWREEDAWVASRHGRPADNVERWHRYMKARRWHRLYKLIGGSYVREMRARRLRGKDLRWFRSHEGLSNSEELLRHCYGSRSIGVAQEP